MSPYYYIALPTSFPGARTMPSALSSCVTVSTTNGTSFSRQTTASWMVPIQTVRAFPPDAVADPEYHQVRLPSLQGKGELVVRFRAFLCRLAVRLLLVHVPGDVLPPLAEEPHHGRPLVAVAVRGVERLLRERLLDLVPRESPFVRQLPVEVAFAVAQELLRRPYARLQAPAGEGEQVTAGEIDVPERLAPDPEVLPGPRLMPVRLEWSLLLLSAEKNVFPSATSLRRLPAFFAFSLSPPQRERSSASSGRTASSSPPIVAGVSGPGT